VHELGWYVASLQVHESEHRRYALTDVREGTVALLPVRALQLQHDDMLRA
jgi:hypothetical protein